MPNRRRYLIALLLLVTVSGVIGYLRRDPQPTAPAIPAHSYAKALRQAHDGEPGAARVLYQQLQRNDLAPIRRAALHAELPNYPSPGTETRSPGHGARRPDGSPRRHYQHSPAVTRSST